MKLSLKITANYINVHHEKNRQTKKKYNYSPAPCIPQIIEKMSLNNFTRSNKYSYLL